DSATSSRREHPLPRPLLRHLEVALERFLLGLRELLRHGHLHAGEQVAAPVALEMRSAAALHPQELAAFRPGRDLERHGAVGSRYLDAGAECGLSERHRNLEHEVRATALEERRRIDVDDHVQVAGGTAVVTGFALPFQADAGPRLRTRGNLHAEPLRGAFPSAAAAASARALDDRAVAVAAR